MKKYLIFSLLLILFLGTANQLAAQTSKEELEKQLEILAVDNPGLDNTVELSFSGVRLDEFIRSIANANELNISVGDGLDVLITNNFSNATVADVLVFLVERYKLDVKFTGNIITIEKYNAPPPVKEEPKEKVLNIEYKKGQNLLSLDLEEDKLTEVVKKITDLSTKNIILSPELKTKQVSVYIKDMPFESAIEKFAFANDMSSSKTEDNYYLLSPKTVTAEKGQKNTQGKRPKNQKKPGKRERTEGLYMEMKGLQDISITAEDASLDEIIKVLAEELKINYYLYSKIEGDKTLNLQHANFNDILDHLFDETPYTYKKVNGVYLIGDRKAEGLRKTTVYQLQNRSVEKLMEFIPEDLKKEVELKEFIDLNSLLISGSVRQTNELILFLEKIDQVTPVVSIDVIIIDFRKNRSISTGISAGLGDKPSGPTEGSILSDANFSFSAASLNNIISNINAGSTINLGKVTPNFYLSVKALETDGILRVRSTPKLATLNGHEAELSIGNTEYYVNEQVTFQGSLNPNVQNNRTYVAIQADLKVKIKPVVSGNDQITMEIEVEQSDFTERISEEAPPGKVTRKFTSMLRVKNNEIILLGGLEEKSRNDSGSGLPLIARIPVLKWIFGNRTRAKGTNQLNVFIKPTVIY